MKQKHALNFFVAFLCLIGSNVAVAESLFASLHDVVDHDYHQQESEDHYHHSPFHPGHDMPHEHEGMPEHEHQCKSAHDLAIINASVVNPEKDLEVVSHLTSIVLSLLTVPESSSVIIVSDSTGPPCSGFFNLSSPRAPPSLSV